MKTIRFDKTQAKDDFEAEVAGALAASETVLSHARDEVYGVPDFIVSKYDYLLCRPSQVSIDRDHDHKPDGTANISYTIFGNLKEIDIDGNNDGKIDSKIVNHRNIFGWSKGMDYYKDASGPVDAKIGLWWSGFPWRRIRDMQFSDAHSGQRIADMKIEYGIFGVKGFTIDRDLDGKPDNSGTTDRYFFPQRMVRFGNIY